MATDELTRVKRDAATVQEALDLSQRKLADAHAAISATERHRDEIRSERDHLIDSTAHLQTCLGKAVDESNRLADECTRLRRVEAALRTENAKLAKAAADAQRGAREAAQAELDAAQAALRDALAQVATLKATAGVGG
jgi:hypothetical protein